MLELRQVSAWLWSARWIAAQRPAGARSELAAWEAAYAPWQVRWLRHFRAFPPFTAHLTVHFPGDARLSILNAASPVSAKKTRLFCLIARNFDTDLPVEDVHAFNHRVFAEDAGMVEQQKPENLPLDPKLEAHIPADRSSINYRRALRDMGLTQFFFA